MMLRDLLAVNNVKIRANTLISAVTDEGAVVLANDGTESVIEADTVIFAIGLKPNKSYAHDLLGSGIAADHVIHLRYTSEALDDSMTAKQMYRDIKEKMTDSERYYLLLDEVQEVDGWEKAVNSLLEDSYSDIYVFFFFYYMLSSEIDT